MYEYANHLVARGHRVAVIQPRRLKYPPPERWSPYRWARRQAAGYRTRFSRLTAPDWQGIDDRVEQLLTRDSGWRYLPDADALFATSWHTVRSVLECPPEKGAKCYFIQGYESYHARKDLVDATWRAPLHKVVIAEWLVRLGEELGCRDLTYIPNAIDHTRYQLVQRITGRRRQVAMVFSTAPVKGSVDGIEALRVVKERFPDVRVVLFGVSSPQPWIPAWAKYYRNPPQDFIVNEIYNQSSIFLAPSLSEGLGLPPLEAAACGCAVVATDIGGFRERFTDQVTALLSPPGNPEALARNVLRLLEDDDRRVRLAAAAKQVVSQLRWQRSADLFEQFLACVVDNESESPRTICS